jgi:hypothetical protein
MSEPLRSAAPSEPAEARSLIAEGESAPGSAPAHTASRIDTRLSLRVVGLVAVILAAHALLAWHLRAWGITTGDDDAGYVLLARSLRGGHYRDLHDALLPVAARYPPGYPALLAIVSLVTGERIGVYVAVSIASSVAALWLLFDGARRTWSVELGVMVLALAAVNPFLIQNAGRVMSEAPFTALVMLSVWAVLRFDDAPSGAWLAGGAAIAADLTRSAGLPLLAALGLVWLLQKRFKRVVVFAVVTAATCGVWTTWTLVAPNAAERGLYVADAAARGHSDAPIRLAMIDRIVTNAMQYATQFLPAELPLPSVRGTVLDNVIGLAIVAVCLTVGFATLWRRWRVAALFLGLYGVLLVVWAWPIDRFLDPVLPLLFLTLLAGATVLTNRWTVRGWVAAMVLTVSVGLAALMADRTLAAAERRCDRRNPTASAGCVTEPEIEFFAASRFTAANTSRDAVVVTAKARPFYYYSNRRTVSSTAIMGLPPERLVARMRESSAEYLLLTSLGFLAPAVRQVAVDACGSFTVVRAFGPTTMLLRLRTDSTEAPGPSACTQLGATTGTAAPVSVRQ